MTFRELAQAMAIDDVVMAQHIDALLRDFVEDYRTLFGFWDGVPAESALADAGWRWFRTGHLRLRDDEPLPRIEFVGGRFGRIEAGLCNARWVRIRSAASR